MVNPRRVHERIIGSAGDQGGECAAAEVGCGDSVADVAAAPSHAGGSVQAHRRPPIARDTQGTTPGMGEAIVRQRGEHLSQRLSKIVMNRAVGLAGGVQSRTEAVGSPSSAECDAVIGGALSVDDQVTPVGEGGSAVQADVIPGLRGQGFGSDHQGVDRQKCSVLPGDVRGVTLRASQDVARTYAALGRSNDSRLDRCRRGILEQSHAARDNLTGEVSHEPSRLYRGAVRRVRAREDSGRLDASLRLVGCEEFVVRLEPGGLLVLVRGSHANRLTLGAGCDNRSTLGPTDVPAVAVGHPANLINRGVHHRAESPGRFDSRMPCHC